MLSVQPALTPAGVRAGLQASARPFPSSGVAGDPNHDRRLSGARRPSSNWSATAPRPLAAPACSTRVQRCARPRAFALRDLDVSPAAPVAGQAVALSGVGSTAAPGRSVAGWQWSLVDARHHGQHPGQTRRAATATLQPTAAGTATVRLVVTDDLGVAVARQLDIVVAAAPVAPPPAAGGGGGAMSWLWLLALTLATVIWRTPGCVAADRRRTARRPADNFPQ